MIQNDDGFVIDDPDLFDVIVAPLLILTKYILTKRETSNPRI